MSVHHIYISTQYKCRRWNYSTQSMKNRNAYHVSAVFWTLKYPLNHSSNPQQRFTPFVPELFIFLALISFCATLGFWVFFCSWDKEAGAILCLAASGSRVLRGQWPAEVHKSYTCTHKDREGEREIKKISVRDWLLCCLVKLNCREVKKPQTFLCIHISYPPRLGPWITKALH